jgi:hypothetical protein
VRRNSPSPQPISVAQRLIEAVVVEHDEEANYGAAALLKALDLLNVEGSEDRAMSVLGVLVAHFDKELSEALNGGF